MKHVRIGNLEISSNVSLAPMAGITDYVLRNIVRKFSPTCLLTTEMISSEALIQESKRKKPLPEGYENTLVKRNLVHSPVAYQLTGHKPYLMADAAKILAKYADIIDINMGCPVNKVVKGQDGCALMRNPALACDIIKAIKDVVDLPISVKFRLGYTQDELNFVQFGEAVQKAGADLITIHARTRSQMYSGSADWEKIAKLTKVVDIPVFANGDIHSVENAQECIALSKATGIAIGRGVLGNVDLIARIEHYFETGEILKPISLDEKIKVLKEHIKEEILLRGDDVGIKFVRKFYPYYISGIKNAAKYRAELVLENDYDKIENILNRISEKEKVA